MKAAVIVFPGSNCDRDIKVALEQSMGRPPDMVWHGESELPKVDLIVVPGGFSYGDYLRSGAMAVHAPAMREVIRRARDGAYVLGICNGFQILTEAGLLPGVLMRNTGLNFICRDVWLRVEAADTPFTSSYEPAQVIRLPIAHRDGSYHAGEATLKAIHDHGQVAFRYCTKEGALEETGNPNGSLDAIAGLFNERRNVLGMMPHPERLADPALGGTDGRAMFQSLIEAFS
jgi:phosphoribosylformylglycinamidine synthase